MPEYFAIRERAYTSLLERGDRLAAAEAALWLGTQKIVQGEVAEGGGWIARAARIVGEDGTDSRAAAFLNVAGAFEAAGSGDLERAARHLRGVRPGRPASGFRGVRRTVPAPAGPVPVGGRPHRRGARLPRRGDARRRLGRLLGPGRRHHLLRCDRGLLVDLRAHAGAAVDRRDDAVGRGAAGPRQLHRRVQGTPGRAQAVQRPLARGARRAGRGEPRRTRTSGRPAGLPACAGTSTGCSAGSTRPRSTSRSRRSSARTRSPGSRCFGWPAGACRQRPPWPDARSPRRTRPASASRCSRAATEILLAVGETDAAEVTAGELRDLATVNRSPVVIALGQHAQASVCLARGAPAEALPLLREALGTWVRTRAPYEEARTRVLLADACRALGDRESADREVDTRAGDLRGPRRDAGPGPAHRQLTSCSVRASSRCCGWSPPVPPTAPSPSSWC